LIAGLGQGADEYMTKPFSPKVLVARVRALLRRSRSAPDKASPDIFHFGPYTLDRSTFLLKRGDKVIPLSDKEFGVLSCLAERASSEVPQMPQSIYNAVWGSSYGGITVIAVYIQRLRKKIEDDPANPVYLETVYGRGYRLRVPPESSDRDGHR
jgi:two-component system response regulator RegX3